MSDFLSVFLSTHIWQRISSKLFLTETLYWRSPTRKRAFDSWSRLLSCAPSDGFAVLLCLKFAEGQALTTKTSSPCEIGLHDDAIVCIQMVLEVIYFRFDELPQRIDSETIVNLTILIDEYFLSRSMKSALHRLLFPTPSDDLYAFLQAALILDTTEAFAVSSVEQKRKRLRPDIPRQLQFVAYLKNDTLCTYKQYIANRSLGSLDSFNHSTSGMRTIGLDTAFSDANHIRLENSDTKDSPMQR